jgi:sodium transport system permease protein
MQKEFREIFRDRRTLMSVIIGPLLITPSLFALIGTMVGGQMQKARTEAYPVGIVGGEANPKLMQAFETARQQAAPNLHISPVPTAKAETWIREHKLNAVAALPPNADVRLEQRQAIPIQILEDAGNEKSQTAASRLSSVFDAVGKHLVEQRLEESHLPPEFATPFHITEQPIAQGGSAATIFLSMMLPYILIFGAFGGAIYAAFDQVAGEKERGTLETLLVSPASRRDIVLGKFSAVVAVCILSSLLSILGFIIPFYSGLKAYAWLSHGGAHLSPAAIGVTLLVMLPISVLFAGALLAASTFARNQKEAQTYLAWLLPLVLFPAMMSMFIGTDVGKQIALVPILGAAVIIKQALSNTYDPLFIILAFAASVFWAGVALTFATRLFQKESVLLKA